MGLLSSRRNPSKGSLSNRVPILRWFGPSLTTSIVAAAFYFVVTGKIDLSALDSLGTPDTVVDVQPVTLESRGPRSADTVRIATFNIQTFGEKKSSLRDVPEGVDVLGTIAKIISNFDLVAIQEVRSSDGTPVRRLIDLLNASGRRYTATISEPIGDEHYTESYAFVWDDTRIKVVQNSAYVVHDDHQRMYREPMVASFEVRLAAKDSRRPFRFTMINAHTDPDQVKVSVANNEINVLDDVFVRVRQYEFETAGEEDCIMVGDLNVDSNGLQELAMIPNLVTVAGDIPTNTRRTATYDHILIDQNMTREYAGRCGVIDFQRDLGLSEQQALLISDHMPLWAEFSVYEVPQVEPVASANTRMIR